MSGHLILNDLCICEFIECNNNIILWTSKVQGASSQEFITYAQYAQSNVKLVFQRLMMYSTLPCNAIEYFTGFIAPTSISFND